MPQGPYLRKYGVSSTVDFILFETDGVDLKVDAAHASGDTKIMKDEGDEANTDNGFVDEGQGYSILLSTTEMQAARIMVHVVDQGTKAWLDTTLVIETYGHASAMHAFDLDTATVTLPASEHTNIADETFKRDWTSITGEAARSLLNAVRRLRNKASISGDVLTVTKENDSTAAWTGTVVTDPDAEPIISMDPT